MASSSMALSLLLLPAVAGQRAGTVSPEAAPSVTIERCTKAAGCIAEEATLTLDANWRWMHNAAGYTNCMEEGVWDIEICANSTACAANCAIEGVDLEGYRKTYGVLAAEDGGMELQFVSEAGGVGSRIYVTEKSEDTYKMFQLKNREFTFDVDTASVPCGMNGAIYFVEMDARGGNSTGGNGAGAKLGTGYCDAQCPHDIKFLEGEANLYGQYGHCCHEMDIWEANSRASVYTPHPCTLEGPLRCTGETCGDGLLGERYLGVCDKDGCDLNAFRVGQRDFYGNGTGFAVDASKKMTVVTQFITSDGTDAGDLVEIKRLYVQDGTVIEHVESAHPDISGNSLTDEFCSAQKAAFAAPDDHKNKGGLKAMGDALGRGMVLALSLWDDEATQMRWLDSTFPAEVDGDLPGVRRGPCDGTTSHPEFLREHHTKASVKYTKIRYGEIGSTFTGEVRRLRDVFV